LTYIILEIEGQPPTYSGYNTMSSVIIAGSQDARQLQVSSCTVSTAQTAYSNTFLQDDIQTELVLRGMSDAEDSTMAEYVAVMLSEFFGRWEKIRSAECFTIVNQKTAGG
jgi:hypothetical protein